MNIILSALLFIFVTQMIFFVIAAINKTDKVTDLSYGLTFVIVSIALFNNSTQHSAVKLILTILVSAWGLRLAGYLFYRILKIKTDKRFDGIRENPLSFFKFWLVQAVAIWIILLPVIIVLGKDQNMQIEALSVLGLLISIFGITIETIADMQKFIFKSKPENKDNFIRTGLWKYSRHPNYFGEILMWVGVFVFSVPFLIGIELVSVVSPLFIFLLLRFFSGVPTIEKKYAVKYKDNPEYQDYLKNTNMFVPG